MQRITLCVIAKNEEALLDGCLASVRGLADAIVVVDTGSTDRTLEIARRHGATIVEHAWDDDFSAARNAALPHVRGGFVLVLDADERLGPGAKSAIRKALRRDDFDCGLLPLHNADALDAQPTDVVNGRARRGEPVALPRLLRRTPDLRWEGVVHEHVGAWARAHRRIQHIRAPIVHYGAVPSLRDARAKDERNRKLLERRCQLEPENPTPRAYLARELERLGDSSGALRSAETCWALLTKAALDGRPDHDVVLPATLLAFLSLREGRTARALEVLSDARRWSEAHPNLDLLEGCAHEKLALNAPDIECFAGELALARAAFERCLSFAGRDFAAETMPGATGHAGHTRLATVELLSGDCERALVHFRAALEDCPRSIEAQLGVVEALLDSGRAAAALQALQPCLEQPRADAWLLGAACADALGASEDAAMFLERVADALARHTWVAEHRAGRHNELVRLLDPAGLVPAQARSDAATDVSVIVPAFNRLDLLRPVLEALARQTTRTAFEVVVVDDGSTPPVGELLRSLALPRHIRGVAREHNGGRGAALNTGLRSSRGELVIFCDSDIVPDPEWIDDHARFHRDAGDARATCLGALEWAVDAGLYGAWTGARSNPRLRGGTRPVDWTQWFTDNWSCRRSLLAENDLWFDEEYKAWGFEELDLALRLTRAGATNTLIEGARGKHLKCASPAQMIESFARSAPNLLRLAAKFPDDPTIREWTRQRTHSAEALTRSQAMFDTLWHKAQEVAAFDATLSDAGNPLVQTLAEHMSDFTFRLGLARGLAQQPQHALDTRPEDDLEFLLAGAAATVALATFEQSRGRSAEARATLDAGQSWLFTADERSAWRDRVQYELRKQALPLLAGAIP
ncbi:MAG: glycosyltransferase [Planctomycetes bacterium]|nr:glycosyltransferase [Planctomycetota bacterium]